VNRVQEKQWCHDIFPKLHVPQRTPPTPPLRTKHQTRYISRLQNEWPNVSIYCSGGFHFGSRLQLKCDGTRWHTGGEAKGKLANEVGTQYSSHYLGTWYVYPALLPLMRTPRLPVVDWTDAPCRFKWTRPVSLKDEIWFLPVCHHIFNWTLLKMGVKSRSSKVAWSTAWISKPRPTGLYRVIKKYLCTWWLQYRKLQVMFKVSPASFQTFIDTPNCVLEHRV
jgi:hypothetical protein